MIEDKTANVVFIIMVLGAIFFALVDVPEPETPYWLTEKTYKGELGQSKVYCNAHGDCEVER